ncbi:hypothetical protein MVEG_04569 [Podila verticillata NRRL 6337]|nr:hypothetical protein MVEG_04569 [Podila verticillata NRRL 6337]
MKAAYFRSRFASPRDYPSRPPRVAFLVQIYHPGIDDRGRNCLDSLDNLCWSPAMTLARVLESLTMLLLQPSPDDLLMVEIARELSQHPERFDRTWTRMFASPLNELSRRANGDNTWCEAGQVLVQEQVTPT